jgi:hypothetical protein
MTLHIAQFGPLGGTLTDVMFNPASVKVSMTNKMPDNGKDSSDKDKTAKKDAQFAKATTTKMETELVFDTTEGGSDVRLKTRAVSTLALSVAAADGKGPAAAPKVTMVWGSFAFEGIIESLTETLDFWAAEGVPLRATLQLSLIGTDARAGYFDPAPNSPTVTLGTAPPNGATMTAIATFAGDANAGRALAAANGAESMRFGTGGPVAVSAGVQLQAAAAFSAGASIGVSAGAGISVGASAGAGAGFGIGAVGGAAAGFSAGAGIGFGASAGIGISASVGVSAGIGVNAGASAGFSASASASVGVMASAGVSASAGAFAGLGPSKAMTLSARIDPSLLRPSPIVAIAGPGSSFDVTGRLVANASAGLSADVSGSGAWASAGVRIS